MPAVLRHRKEGTITHEICRIGKSLGFKIQLFSITYLGRGYDRIYPSWVKIVCLSIYMCMLSTNISICVYKSVPRTNPKATVVWALPLSHRVLPPISHVTLNECVPPTPPIIWSWPVEGRVHCRCQEDTVIGFKPQFYHFLVCVTLGIAFNFPGDSLLLCKMKIIILTLKNCWKDQMRDYT